MTREVVRSIIAGLVAMAAVVLLVIFGSRRMQDFDAALVAYTFATIFAAFGIAYRYSMWLHRPPTALYFRRGWRMFLRPQWIGRNLAVFGRRLISAFALNRFIWRRGRGRWGAHWLIMWGTIIAALITFPLVLGLVHFESPPDQFEHYTLYVLGFGLLTFPVDSLLAHVIFGGLVWSSFLVIAGVMLAFRRRMRDHGAAAVQQFGHDILPLLMLFAISITGLAIWVSYKFMAGYAFEFLAITHAVTVIFTLLWLPFGKFFHIFQRPAQLGVAFYRDVGASEACAACVRCGDEFAIQMQVDDLIQVERELGYSYELEGGVDHYQRVCPRCRRSMLAIAQGRLWSEAYPDIMLQGGSAMETPGMDGRHG